MSTTTPSAVCGDKFLEFLFVELSDCAATNCFYHNFHLFTDYYNFLSGDFNGFYNTGNHRVGCRAVEFGFGAEREAMPQNRQSNIAHVVRRRKITPANCCECF